MQFVGDMLDLYSRVVFVVFVVFVVVALVVVAVAFVGIFVDIVADIYLC